MTAGKMLTLTGAGIGSGCKVTLTAVVTGVSPYAAVMLPSTTATANGAYTIRWHVPRSITDTLPWQITGSENCGA
ncbi:MAG: hypothetical protein ACRDLT_03325 [Solirubrobacteraceae bacterium]